ncbi:transglutaminase-like domain-containing protein [Paenibacillus oenotherae]|uniref:Transglutaminase-like domain-containing protein n=1 Tax=Paenibacillus oenotherae TaxID=1435645 RepID=A0ABS7D5E8_9BACL|nr:transglutaminase-like domain-containing protein [Paenibacillus oenotherae]MBW7474398.1 transglutaminase-like domain-containing protein [Paenibacillus oenotherae]
MNTWVQALLKPEPVALMVMLVLVVSLVQGLRSGASGSAKRLFFFVWTAALVVISLLLAGRGAAFLSPHLRAYLIERNIVVPQEQLGALSQFWYTFVTSIRDFELLRFGLLFLLCYMLLRFVLGFLEPLGAMLFERYRSGGNGEPRQELFPQAASRTTGAAIGALLGAGRAFVVIAILFVYVSLLPDGPLTDSIRASSFYNKTADELLQPVAGDVLERGPVLTGAVEAEFRRVLQRKYEVIDSAVPDNIAEAAHAVAKDAESDREKARALYDWIGSRIAYDWDKADNYVEQGIWKEQTPADTFGTRKGVCIDVARLYAVMARTVGLEVRVVTGQGADGRGGYGPHAWNEVRLADGGWIPLDATWASTGDWFDPQHFERTHIRESSITAMYGES